MKNHRRCKRKLATVRMDQIYEDKLDGKISEEFWSRKQAGLRDQELAFEAHPSTLQGSVSEEGALNVERIFELANKAYSLYFAWNSMEPGQLLKKVLLNCTTDGTTLAATYKEPFDLISRRPKTREWFAQGSWSTGGTGAVHASAREALEIILPH